MDLKIKKQGGKEDGWRVLVPEFNENHALPEKSQLSLEIHWLNHGEQKRFAKMVKPRVKGRSITSNAEEIDRLMFVKNVRNIKNLSFDGVVVTVPGDLFDNAPSELITEITKAITEYGAFDEDDIKN